MCLGLATGYIEKPKYWIATIYNECSHVTQQKIFEGKDLWDALRKAQMLYPAPQYSVVSIIEEKII